MKFDPCMPTSLITRLTVSDKFSSQGSSELKQKNATAAAACVADPINRLPTYFVLGDKYGNGNHLNICPMSSGHLFCGVNPHLETGPLSKPLFPIVIPLIWNIIAVYYAMAGIVCDIAKVILSLYNFQPVTCTCI